ncbi:MAG: 2-oxoacid:ferredoxin oxidoreductase subunit beta [Phycisphaerales bacterium]|nr:2-oxoacid:ferredoxin oxidoreductase subunit beta [Phycisphaerales bacterium]
MSTITAAPTAKDFKSDQEVRWCPGCGDYSILAQVQRVLAELGAPRDRTVFVSGIGCSSRFPYYMNTYGFHSIHGRAPAIATGVKVANPELDVWVVTGDGDGLSIGAGQLMHALRRNVGLKILLFNNRIYGLTKGQYSPTSPIGQRSSSTPFGSIDAPVRPVSFALGVGATFVARAVDVDVKSLQGVLRAAAAHRGSAFVEIYQDCNVYNHAAFAFATDRETKEDNIVYVEHGKPLIFGKARDKGLRLSGSTPEVVRLADIAESELLVHDAHAASPAHAFMLAQMQYPALPEPMGVLRAVEAPIFEEQVFAQIHDSRQRAGQPDLAKLLASGDTWDVS